VENNLDKFNSDVVYLKHQNKTHIFPVDKVHYEEHTALRGDSYIDKSIFDDEIKPQVLSCMEDSMNI